MANATVEAPWPGGMLRPCVQLKRRCRKLGHFLSGQERTAAPQPQS